MSDLNKQQIIGNVGNDPEIKNISEKTKKATISVATNHVFKDKNDEKQKETTWHRVVVFGKRAEVVENYVHKGDKIYIEGRTRKYSYEDKNGNTKYMQEVNCENLVLLGSPSGGKTQTPQSEQQSNNNNVNNGFPDDKEDLPF